MNIPQLKCSVGSPLSVTLFRATSTVKVFVGNLSKSTTNDRLRELFETYGGVSEADVLGGFGFVVS